MLFNTLQIITTSSITPANTIKDLVTPTQCVSTPKPFTGKYLVVPESLLLTHGDIRFQGTHAIHAKQMSSLKISYGSSCNATLRMCGFCVRAEEVQQLGECDLLDLCKDHSDPCWTGQTVGLQ